MIWIKERKLILFELRKALTCEETEFILEINHRMIDLHSVISSSVRSRLFIAEIQDPRKPMSDLYFLLQ